MVVITLPEHHAHLAHGLSLLGPLDAFRDKLQPQRAGERGDDADDRLVFRAVRDLADEGFVDLDLVERETPEMSERAIAGAEIVERDGCAQAPQAVQRLGGAGDVVDQRALGDLELQQ
ncbi:hypothetical protein ACVWXN_004001 [Bradyrhizobium sp. i1.4.4]